VAETDQGALSHALSRGPALPALVERIRRHGPVPVSALVDVALYDPVGGFYESGGAAGGRTGDFVTSPTFGPLFGAVVARALDGWWRSLGSPDPFVVVEAGAGRGALARSVLAAGPACAPALRYVLVERSAAQRRTHAEALPLEDPAFAFAPVDPDTEQPQGGLATGPIAVSLGSLPRVPGPVVVLANELVDNLPFGLAEHRDGRWHEVRVGLARSSSLAETLVPLDEERAAVLSRLVPSPADGARVPLQDAARAWLAEALALAGRRGRVVLWDYASTTAGMASRPPGEWLRTYAGHARGGDYLASPGSQDVTCEVALDQLALVRPLSSDMAQADWLRAHGIDDLVEEGRRQWTAAAGAPDVAALRARSRIPESAALTDPAGLGSFRVLEWGGPEAIGAARGLSRP
jgi:SAM-dependent MidA family methyltransferase